MNIDLARLTFAGWALVAFTVVAASAAAFIPIWLITSSGHRVAGGTARVIGIPLAFGAGGATYWLGKKVIGAFKIRVTRDG